MKKQSFTRQDENFMNRNRIYLEQTNEYECDAIIGIEHLWSIIDLRKPSHKLPSGKMAIPTIIGYSICGTPKKFDDKATLRENVAAIKTRNQ